MPAEAFTIAFLADVPHAVVVLAHHFEQTWSPYYGPEGPGDAVADLRACCQRTRLPVAWVALNGAGHPIGTLALKERSVSHHHLSPWVAAFVVTREERGKGVGAALLSTAENDARRRGLAQLYMSGGGEETDVTRGVLAARGWQAFDRTPTLRGTVVVYRLEL